MNELINDLQATLGIRFFDYQLEAFEKAQDMWQLTAPRRCLYYKTGAGKSITSLIDMKIWNVDDVLVICPPSTYDSWVAAGGRLGMNVECMSHAKFRDKKTQLRRDRAVIADEMHLFGGHGGKGWQKLDRLARGLQAPMILASATPNYNDADRVYCIQHILDPRSCHGGFLEFLYQHCTTEQNPFGMMPIVTGFQRFPDAAAYLAALPGVDYLPDDLVYTIGDIGIPEDVDIWFERFGYNKRSERIIASQMEGRHARINLSLIDDNGLLKMQVFFELEYLVGNATTPVLIYANHSTVAEALARQLHHNGVKHGLITGGTPAKKKTAILDEFRGGVLDVLVGTASLATGTDGLDKVCDTLIILDDTDDDSLRRQLIGRIMPRGAGGSASAKQVYRLVLQ